MENKEKMQKKERDYRIIKYLRRIAGLLAGLVIVAGIAGVLNKLYVPNAGGELNGWSRFVWHHFYEHEGEIDHLYLGSSHLYCAIDPRILDELNGGYNFNLTCAGQPLNVSYYSLREADRLNDISHVYLEMYHGCSLNDGRLSMDSNLNTADYMKLSFNKVAYEFSLRRISDLAVKKWFPFFRYRENVGDWDYVKDRLADKKQENYLHYQWKGEMPDGEGDYTFYEQGFLGFDMPWINEEDRVRFYRQEYILTQCAIGKKNEKYLRKIITYCQERGISITLFVSPVVDLELISTQDYDDYNREIRKIAAEYDVPFYDFNLTKEEYLSTEYNNNFKDPGHLNERGAKVFTPFFYEVVSRSREENQAYFYDSYKEKLRNLPPTVFGVYFLESSNAVVGQEASEIPAGQEPVINMWIASNRDTGLEYRVVLTPEGKQPYVIQEFGENKAFQVPETETGYGVWTITIREKGSAEPLQTLETFF